VEQSTAAVLEAAVVWAAPGSSAGTRALPPRAASGAGPELCAVRAGPATVSTPEVGAPGMEAAGGSVSLWCAVACEEV